MPIEQNAFDEMKRIGTHYVLLIYLYFNERFDIHTDASEFQLGSVISQNGKPIAFYICNTTGPQHRYTVTE